MIIFISFFSHTNTGAGVAGAPAGGAADQTWQAVHATLMLHLGPKGECIDIAGCAYRFTNAMVSFCFVIKTTPIVTLVLGKRPSRGERHARRHWQRLGWTACWPKSWSKWPLLHCKIPGDLPLWSKS